MADNPEPLRLYKKRKEQDHSPVNVEKQHALGKLTARERIDLLLDPGSFYEFDAFMEKTPLKFGREESQNKQAVITGTGRIRS